MISSSSRQTGSQAGPFHGRDWWSGRRMHEQQQQQQQAVRQRQAMAVRVVGSPEDA